MADCVEDDDEGDMSVWLSEMTLGNREESIEGKGREASTGRFIAHQEAGTARQVDELV